MTPQSGTYFDSNILIYAIEDQNRYHEPAKAFVADAHALGTRLVTSEVTVAECLYRPYRDRNRPQAELYEALFKSGLFELTPVNGDLMIRAVREGGALGLKLIDAVHYLSALEAGCDQFVTADRKFKSSRYLDVVII